MIVMEYHVRCPACNTESRIVTEEANPIIHLCMGCERGIVLHNNSIYTVGRDFLLHIMRRHKTKRCGNVVASHLSSTAKGLVTSRKIGELHDLLEKDIDVKDFLKRIS